MTSRRPHAPEPLDADLQARAYAFDQQRAAAVVIDPAGTIVDANASWRLFARLNDGSPDTTDLGTNYLDVCERAAQAGSSEGADAVHGLRRVLGGQADGFDLTYQCSSSSEERWFRLHAVAAPVGFGRGAVIQHIDITADRARLTRGDDAHHLDRETGLLDVDGVRRAIDELVAVGRDDGATSCAIRVGLVGLTAIAQHSGHAAANTVLVRSASRVRFAATTDDVVGRVGPHELIVLCPSTTVDQAHAFAGRLAGLLVEPHHVGAEALSIDAVIDVIDLGDPRSIDAIVADPPVAPELTIPPNIDPDHARWPSAASELGADLARRLGSPTHHRIIIDALSEGILVQDTVGTVLFASDTARELLAEVDLRSMTPLPGWTLVDGQGAPLTLDQRPGRIALSQRTAVRDIVIGIKGPYGVVRWLEANSQLAANESDDEPFAIVSSIRDVTDRRVATDRFRMQALLLSSISQAVTAWDAEGTITFMNEIAEEFYGWPDGTSIGQNIHDIAGSHTSNDRIQDLREAIASGRSWEGELVLQVLGSAKRTVLLALSPIVEGDTTTGFISVATDISDRRAAQSQIEHQATHDPLTDLPNRRALLSAVHDALEPGGGTTSASVSLALISLGPLDVVNDAYGHAAGDAVVLVCANELAAATHHGDLLARFSDHAFAVLCQHSTEVTHTRSYAETLRAAISHPVSVGSTEVSVRAAAGVAVANAGNDAAELLRHVDTALLRARKHGTTQVYDREIDARLRHELELEALVERVIASGEVTLGYQPIVGLHDEHTLGAEALLRLVDDDGNPISPIEVIEAAERSGSIVELGDLILRTACRQAAKWQIECTDHATHVSVNVSGRQLDDPELVHRIDAALTAAGLAPELLWLEVTESALMEDPDRSIAILDELHARGITLAADDFGTGYSSLSHLKRLPLDVVKVDRSFVSGLPDDHEDLAITRAIMALADALGLQVVAEGVEQADQLEMLRGLGIHFGQGYLWSKAVPADDFRAFACRQRCCSAAVS